jgi:hypothetical protein
MDIDRRTYEERYRPIYDVSVMICTTPNRCIQLNELLKDIEHFKNETELTVEVLMDNRTDISTGTKRNDMLYKANGKYSCFIDDDDKITPNYFKVIERALKDGDYDCIALNGRYYENGIFNKPFYHSIKYQNWWSDEHGYYRNPNHLNPIRTSICKKIWFPHITSGEDHIFSKNLYASGMIKTEYSHNDVQYLYYKVI